MLSIVLTGHLGANILKAYRCLNADSRPTEKKIKTQEIAE